MEMMKQKLCVHFLDTIRVTVMNQFIALFRINFSRCYGQGWNRVAAGAIPDLYCCIRLCWHRHSLSLHYSRQNYTASLSSGSHNRTLPRILSSALCLTENEQAGWCSGKFLDHGWTVRRAQTAAVQGATSVKPTVRQQQRCLTEHIATRTSDASEPRCVDPCFRLIFGWYLVWYLTGTLAIMFESLRVYLQHPWTEGWRSIQINVRSPPPAHFPFHHLSNAVLPLKQYVLIYSRNQDMNRKPTKTVASQLTV